METTHCRVLSLLHVLHPMDFTPTHNGIFSLLGERRPTSASGIQVVELGGRERRPQMQRERCVCVCERERERECVCVCV